MPPGNRTYTYTYTYASDADGRRLKKDAFGSGGLTAMEYKTHDGLGNVLDWSTRSPLYTGDGVALSPFVE